MDVGIRELEQHLSEYLDRAERGEIIRITDRGRPKVMLTRVMDDAPLRRGIEEGWIREPVRGGPLEPFEGFVGC